MKYHLEETESDDLRRKMERERALRHKASVSRDSRQAFMCVFPTVCVCVCACLQHTDVPNGAQDEGGGEKEKMCCPGHCLSVYSSVLVKRGHSMLFFLILHQIMNKINLFL